MYSPGATLWALMVVAPPAPTGFDATRVSDIEVTSTDEAAEVLVYDDAGELSAALLLWIDSDGRVRVDSDFADGLYLSAVIDGDDTRIESNDRAEVARRLSTIIDSDPQIAAPEAGTTAASLVGCGWGVVTTVGACAAAQAIFCVGGAVVAACECLPLIVDEWEEYSCPYFG